MGDLLNRHSRSTVGPTSSLTVNDSSSALQLASNVGNAPLTFLLRAETADMRIRQGDSSVSATANSMLLKKDETLKVTVESANDNHIAAIRDGSTNGTLRATEMSNSIPGAGSDS